MKVWLVTGASRGFGAAISKAVLAAGDRLIATGRGDVPDFGGGDAVLTASMDVTDDAQVRTAIAAALDRFGRIDVLVNNAGFGVLGAVEETSADEVEAVFRTNVFGVLNVTRAVLPAMRTQRAGHVINLSSIGGYRAAAGWGVYCATKFAVEGLTEALHAELAPLGVHVTVVEPGYFRTDFLDARSMRATARRIDDYAETAGRTRAAAVEKNHAQPGDPTKLAQALLELVASPAPPLRLPLGTDTLAAIEAKNAAVADETARWRALSASTDY
jgi:NAD(P)-dependent dehydrogenase (short-subunit alcohol dehydrogenase family)